MTIKQSILQFMELYNIPFSHKLKSFNSTLYKQYTLQFDEIASRHKEYATNISSPDMAMSLELANFIFAYCLKNKPLNLLDLGSGFSSYVFRLYQKHSEQPVLVHSIDDNDEWLKKTKDYLIQKNVNADYLFNLDSFQKSAEKAFYNFILLDLNFVEKRKDYIDFAAELLTTEGAMIVDDVHKVEFLRDVKTKAKKSNYKLFNIKKQTKDAYGRFSILLMK